MPNNYGCGLKMRNGKNLQDMSNDIDNRVNRIIDMKLSMTSNYNRN